MGLSAGSKKLAAHLIRPQVGIEALMTAFSGERGRFPTHFFAWHGLSPIPLSILFRQGLLNETAAHCGDKK
jgi:hypothetical protein